jgi:hypothetical protein
LVRKLEGKSLLGRSRRKWEDYVKMDGQEVGWGGTWIGSSWLRLGTDGGLL